VSGSPCTNLGTFINGRVEPKRVKDNGTIHRLNLTWKPSDDEMVYATWSKGFRPGGINRRSTIAPYQADFLTNTELGFKTSWMDRKLKLNGAVYMQDWEAFQFAFLGQNSFTEIHNGPDARIKGLELDASFRVTDRLTLSGSGAYTDASTQKNLCKIDDPTYSCTGAGNSISAKKGTRLPVTPKIKANMMARYVYPLMNGDAHFQAVVVNQGSASSDIRSREAALLGDIKGYTTVDVSYGIDWAHFSAEVYIDNLLDERAELSRNVQCGQCYSRPYVVTNTPQTFGLRGGYKF
jgi:outer membrane receptor protein involved in Fe transport